MDLHRKLLIFLTSVLCPLTSIFGQTGDIFVDQDHNGHKIFGLPTPVAGDEAATKAYADSIVGGGGATNFLDLTDTPNSYSGQGGKVVAVNVGATALEFVTAAGGGSVTSLTATTPIIVTPSPIVTTGVISLDSTSKTNWDTAYTDRLKWDGGATGLVAATGRTSLELGTAAQSDTGDFEVPLTFSQSLSRSANTVTLSGDSATPGNTKYYGTDSGGTKGWFALPAFGTLTEINTTSPITGGPINSIGTIGLDVGVDHAFTAAQGITVNDAATAAITKLLTLSHNSSGTVSDSAGFGTGVLFQGESTTTTNQNMGEIAAVWQVATHASRKSRLQFSAADSSGLSTNTMYLYPNGSLSLNDATEYGAGVMNTAGYKISGAASSGKFLLGNGTIYTASGYTMPTSAGSAGTFLRSNGTNLAMSSVTWPNSSGIAGYEVMSDGTNFVSYPSTIVNSNTSSNTGFASDQYITGSAVTVAAGDFKAKGQYRCVFDMVKTNQGTTAIVITLRIGTAGTTGDTSRMTFTFGNATAAVDTGQFEIIVNFRSVGSGTSAVVSGYCRAAHNLATTGLFNNASQWTIVGAVSGGFDSSTATTIGLSFNGGTSFAGTNTTVQATLNQP